MASIVYDPTSGAICLDPDGKILACCDEQTFVCGGCPSPDPNLNQRRPRVRIDGIDPGSPCADMNGRIYTLGNPLLGGVFNSTLCLWREFASSNCLSPTASIDLGTALTLEGLTDIAISINDAQLPSTSVVFATFRETQQCSSIANLVLPFVSHNGNPASATFGNATATIIGFF